MKRSSISARGTAVPGVAGGGASAGPRGLLEEREIDEIERAWPDGLTSRQIVDVFETRGIRFSEATLRKYVQLGLLPRSVRVGRKGKHRGSCGLYPAHVVRRVNLVKGMMAEDGGDAESVLTEFARAGIDIDVLATQLQVDGGKSFVKSWQELLRRIATKSAMLDDAVRKAQ